MQMHAAALDGGFRCDAGASRRRCSRYRVCHAAAAAAASTTTTTTTTASGGARQAHGHGCCPPSLPPSYVMSSNVSAECFECDETEAARHCCRRRRCPRGIGTSNVCDGASASAAPPPPPSCHCSQLCRNGCRCHRRICLRHQRRRCRRRRRLSNSRHQLGGVWARAPAPVGPREPQTVDDGGAAGFDDGGARAHVVAAADADASEHVAAPIPQLPTPTARAQPLPQAPAALPGAGQPQDGSAGRRDIDSALVVVCPWRPQVGTARVVSADVGSDRGRARARTQRKSRRRYHPHRGRTVAAVLIPRRGSRLTCHHRRAVAPHAALAGRRVTLLDLSDVNRFLDLLASMAFPAFVAPTGGAAAANRGSRRRRSSLAPTAGTLAASTVRSSPSAAGTTTAPRCLVDVAWRRRRPRQPRCS